MKKIGRILGCLVLFIFIFSACSKNEVNEYNYTYQGENELWSAKYNVKATETFTETASDNLKYDNEMKSEFIVTYKGELTDLAFVKHVEISYECIGHKGSMTNDYDEEGGITSKIFTLTSSGTNTKIPSEDEVVKVTINVDGDVQNLELVSDKVLGD